MKVIQVLKITAVLFVLAAVIYGGYLLFGAGRLQYHLSSSLLLENGCC